MAAGKGGRVKFCRVVVQIHVSDLESLFLADRVLCYELSQSGSESSAAGADGEPEAFFGAECIVKRKGVGAKHHFIGIERDELLENVLELRGVEHFRLQGSVEIDVLDGGKQSGFAFIGPAAVEKDESDVAVARIAENVFEIEDVALAEAEVIADADSAVEVHGQSELGGLID